ncbi:9210_t:CDS:2 [Ambispora gerdemannii]|uniref:9210_t:CDS:1 n=1 Tax=Ambispora gerdemannii TaxID=144530 RepID=A0A9N8W004_9GLOM|nr:9210_t:CDS:2 [Ambispora gerdemannii]
MKTKQVSNGITEENESIETILDKTIYLFHELYDSGRTKSCQIAGLLRAYIDENVTDPIGFLNTIMENPQYITLLGYFYYFGIKINKNYQLAIQCFTKAAGLNDSYAQYLLGMCYDTGIGTIKNKEKSFYWYLQSANNNNLFGQYALADCYFYADGCVEDKRKAFIWTKKSAEGGHAEAQAALILAYEDGLNKDKHKAFAWYKKYVTSGNDNYSSLFREMFKAE